MHSVAAGFFVSVDRSKYTNSSVCGSQHEHGQWWNYGNLLSSAPVLTKGQGLLNISTLSQEQIWIQGSLGLKKSKENPFLGISNLVGAKYSISDPGNSGLQADPEQAGSSRKSRFSFSLRHYAEKLMDPWVKSYFTAAQSQSISLTLFTLHWNRNLEWQDHYHQRKGKSHHGSSGCIV